MKRSEHEDIVLEHLSAMAHADQGKTHAFMERIAGYFGIIASPVEDAEERLALANEALVIAGWAEEDRRRAIKLHKRLQSQGFTPTLRYPGSAGRVIPFLDLRPTR